MYFDVREARLSASVGDPERVVFHRSAAKPFQAVPLVDDQVADRFVLTTEELAVAVAHGWPTRGYIRRDHPRVCGGRASVREDRGGGCVHGGHQYSRRGRGDHSSRFSDGKDCVTDGDRVLIRVSGALASGEKVALVDAFSRARGIAEDSEVEEVLLQAYLFLGFPASLNGMAAWRRLTGSDPTGPTQPDYSVWESRGRDVCGAVYAGQYERLRENIRALHPDLEQWMVVEGYGKVLGRPGLALKTRELCIVATLAVTGASKQLYSHLRGALNVGASPADVDATLAETDRFLDDEGRRSAAALWEKVQRRYAG